MKYEYSKNVFAISPQWLSKTTQNHLQNQLHKKSKRTNKKNTRDKTLEPLMSRFDLQGTNAADLEPISFFLPPIKFLMYWAPDICSLQASGFHFYI